MVLTMRSTKDTEELPVYSFEAVALKIGEYLLCSSWHIHEGQEVERAMLLGR